MNRYQWDALSVNEREECVERGYRVLDWDLRCKAPIYLDAAGYKDLAAALRAAPVVNYYNHSSSARLAKAVMQSRQPSFDRAVDWSDKSPTSELWKDVLYWCMVRTENMDEFRVGFYVEWIIAGCRTLIKESGKPLAEVEAAAARSLEEAGLGFRRTAGG